VSTVEDRPDPRRPDPRRPDPRRPDLRRPDLRRPTGGRLVAGVAAGVADHLGLDPMHVRVAFSVLSALSGFGVVLYAALWVFVPSAVSGDAGPAEPAGLAAASRAGRRPQARAGRRPQARAGRGDAGQLVALGALGLGLLLLLNQVGWGLPTQVLLPVLIAGSGLALLWSQADATERTRVLGRPAIPAGLAGWLTVLRVVGGVALIAVALVTVVIGSSQRSQLGRSILLLVVVGIGLGLAAGPLAWRLLRQLDVERGERLLQQQQADVAAHLHDSVLQTLALIQRQAHDPRAVTALARAQERDLRGWLFASEPAPQGSLRVALEDAAAEVEQAHGVPVEVVVVGDGSLDERSRALVRAAREAMVNASRHSGAPSVDVYAECAGDAVQVFVRDRGCGFDPGDVPPDRMGLAGSVVGRMRRHGGAVRVRSSPGTGTEVALTLPRVAPIAEPTTEPKAEPTTEPTTVPGAPGPPEEES
jgi:signal transduction histidine kinase/phage shock protein PspC (stress-responsive transcriptional regulator)